MKNMQHGGEGKENYKTTKNDKTLGKHGGEGSMKGSDKKLMNPKGDCSYCGPGRNLNVVGK